MRPVMAAWMVISGILMLGLRIIGEYPWRILDETQDMPLSVIDERK